MCASVRAFLCGSECSFSRWCVLTGACACVGACLSCCMLVCVHGYLCACVDTLVHTFERDFVRACLRENMRVL